MQLLVLRRNGSVELSFPATELVGIQSWILGFGAGVEVLGPKDLRNAIAGEHSQAAQLYDRRSRASGTGN